MMKKAIIVGFLALYIAVLTVVFLSSPRFGRKLVNGDYGMIGFTHTYTASPSFRLNDSDDIYDFADYYGRIGDVLVISYNRHYTQYKVEYRPHEAFSEPNDKTYQIVYDYAARNGIFSVNNAPQSPEYVYKYLQEMERPYLMYDIDNNDRVQHFVRLMLPAYLCAAAGFICMVRTDIHPKRFGKKLTYVCRIAYSLLYLLSIAIALRVPIFPNLVLWFIP